MRLRSRLVKLLIIVCALALIAIMSFGATLHAEPYVTLLPAPGETPVTASVTVDGSLPFAVDCLPNGSAVFDLGPFDLALGPHEITAASMVLRTYTYTDADGNPATYEQETWGEYDSYPFVLSETGATFAGIAITGSP